MDRQPDLYAIPTKLTHEIDALCQQAHAPLTEKQRRAIFQLTTALYTRGVLTPTTAQQIAETCQLMRE